MMDRRKFIAGLLATAAIPAPQMLALKFLTEPTVFVEWDDTDLQDFQFLEGISQANTHTFIYGAGKADA